MSPDAPRPHFGFAPGDALLVTGAGSGIGRATALRGAEQGLAVAVWDLDEEAAQQTARQITADGGRAVAVAADVREPAEVANGLHATRAELGAVRHLVNNAGPSSAVALDFEEGLTSGAGSVRRVTEEWLSHGRADDACVVNIASVAGNLVGTDSPWYCATKAAIAGYTRHLATHRSDAVRANAVAPGMVDTPRLAGFAASEVGERTLARNPLHRMATPDDIAYTTLFLLSPLAGYLNGVLLPVDGGWTVTQ